MATWIQRARYEFDRRIAAGTLAMIGWLAALCAAIIVLAALIIVLAGVHDATVKSQGFGEALWASLTRVMDPGTMASDQGWGYRALTFAVTIAGIFVFGSLIAILTTWIGGQLERLRRGRSPVLERNHTIVLGWSPTALSIIDQLVKADPSNRDRIAVMAPRDKFEMEEQINAKVARAVRRGIVLCRTGDPLDPLDIAMMNPAEARAVVILSPDSAHPDAEVIKTMMALAKQAEGRGGAYRIAAEIRDRKNLEAARLAGAGAARLVYADELIARIIVQSCRQSGMSGVYLELLDFDDCEIQPKAAPWLAGITFGEALLAFDDVTPIGLSGPAGMDINPAHDRVIGRGEELITISADRLQTLQPRRAAPAVQAELIRRREHAAAAPEHALILGWNRRGPLVVKELGYYLPEGSQVTVVADVAHVAQDVAAMCGSDSLVGERCRTGDTTDSALLRGLDIAGFSHVIVLGYTDHLDPQQADTRTLITLLHLRNISAQTDRTFNIVTEMLDEQTRELAEVTGADDFVVSERLVSLMLAQVSQDEKVQQALEQLLDPEGAKIYIRPAADYVVLDEPVSFDTVVEAARRRGEVALGYRLDRGGAGRAQTVKLNPAKSASTTFDPGDGVVVLAAR
jgi:voltage-gated potassium channel Kch